MVLNYYFIVCGPPPTAYHPQQPGGSGVISFPKSERFRQDSTPNAGHEPEGTVSIDFVLFYSPNHLL